MLSITENVKGKPYKQLIDLLSKHCNRFAFVENRQMMENEEDRLAYIDNLIFAIKGYLLERKLQRKWKTTKLSGGTAFVFYFQMNNTTRQFLRERSDSLFDWISPELPEDLMFFQNDKCILAGCSHEKFFLVDETIWDRFLLS